MQKWLKIDHSPRDFYELLERKRFDPDLEQLQEAVRSASRELLRLQDHSDRELAKRAMRLQIELGRVAEIMSSADKLDDYHEQMLRSLAEEYAKTHEGKKPPWQQSRLLAWLEDKQNVHPRRSGVFAVKLISLQNQFAPSLDKTVGAKPTARKPVQHPPKPATLDELPEILPEESVPETHDGTAKSSTTAVPEFVRLRCPGGHALKVSAKAAGKKVRCPHAGCGAIITVPGNGGSAKVANQVALPAAQPAVSPAEDPSPNVDFLKQLADASLAPQGPLVGESERSQRFWGFPLSVWLVGGGTMLAVAFGIWLWIVGTGKPVTPARAETSDSAKSKESDNPLANRSNRSKTPEQPITDDEVKYRRAAAAILADPDIGEDEPISTLLLLYRMKNVGLTGVTLFPDCPKNLPVAQFHARFGKPEKTEPVESTSVSEARGPFGIPDVKREKFLGHVYGCVTALQDERTGQIVKLRLELPPGGFFADVWACLKQRPPVRPTLAAPDPDHGVWSDKDWHIRVLSLTQATQLQLGSELRSLKAGKQALLVELEVTALAFHDFEAPGATIQQSTLRHTDVAIAVPGEEPIKCEFVQVKLRKGGWSDPSALGGTNSVDLYSHSPQRVIRAVAVRDKKTGNLSNAKLKLFRNGSVTP